MQTESSRQVSPAPPVSPWRKALTPACITLAFVIVLFLSNRPVTTPEGLPVVYDIPTYQQGLAEVKASSEPIFVAVDQGKSLTDAQAVELQRDAKISDSLSRFDPLAMGPYFVSGKAYEILGDNERADERLRQLIGNVGNLTKEGEETVTESKNLLSTVRGREGQWDSAFALANDAVNDHPDSAVYRTTRASAELQLKRLDAAKKDLAVALTLDPHYAPAQRMVKLIAMDGGLSGVAKPVAK